MEPHAPPGGRDDEALYLAGYCRVGWPSTTLHVGWLLGLWPSPNRILQCAASLAAGGYDRESFSIESGPLHHSKKHCKVEVQKEYFLTSFSNHRKIS